MWAFKWSWSIRYNDLIEWYLQWSKSIWNVFCRIHFYKKVLWMHFTMKNIKATLPESSGLTSLDWIFTSFFFLDLCYFRNYWWCEQKYHLHHSKNSFKSLLPSCIALNWYEFHWKFTFWNQVSLKFHQIVHSALLNVVKFSFLTIYLTHRNHKHQFSGHKTWICEVIFTCFQRFFSYSFCLKYLLEHHCDRREQVVWINRWQCWKNPQDDLLLLCF